MLPSGGQGHAAPVGIGPICRIVKIRQRQIIIQPNQSFLIERGDDLFIFLRGILIALQIDRGLRIRPPGHGEKGSLGKVQQQINLRLRHLQSPSATPAATAAAAMLMLTAHAYTFHLQSF
ncbi:hypothetical protein SDC9_185780 [bioreactor metagenome]|uniref:Uncharacterized protein n=1 Tax=bioreactor metagenome TaxID=1076179 RepID=A0A645HI41_9ZZZZ